MLFQAFSGHDIELVGKTIHFWVNWDLVGVLGVVWASPKRRQKVQIFIFTFDSFWLLTVTTMASDGQ